MKNLLFTLLFLSPWLLAAQTAGKGTPAKEVRLVCNILNAANPAETLNLYEYSGYTHKKVMGVLKGSDGTYTFMVPAGPARFYGVGFQDNALACVVVGEEPEVKVWANATFIEKARTVGSPQNLALEQVNKRMLVYQEAPNDPTLHKACMAYIDSLKKAGSMLWRTANLQTPPFFTGKDANKENEFRAQNWFSHVDYPNDRGYDNQPYTLYAFTNYVLGLSGTASETDMKIWISAQLNRIPTTSPAYRLALAGILRGLQQKQAPALFEHFAKVYIDKYRDSDNGEIAMLEFELNKGGTSTPGSRVPELVGMTPDSGSYKLSNLRGKVVLIDFWASWCAPCRRENPNVRALYAKYKDKGFEVLGVSLDRDMNAWKKAIADDQLPWNHISDLKGWQSAHAAAYSVSSIPQTLLIDKEGKLIVRNLRGESLAAKLYELFGE